MADVRLDRLFLARHQVIIDVAPGEFKFSARAGRKSHDRNVIHVVQLKATGPWGYAEGPYSTTLCGRRFSFRWKPPAGCTEAQEIDLASCWKCISEYVVWKLSRADA